MAGQKFNISFVIGAVDNVTEKVMVINERINRAFSPLKKAGDAFNLLGAELGVNKFGSALANVGEKSKKVFDEFLATGAKLAGVGLAVAGGLNYIVRGAADSVDGISDASQRIGISTAMFQGLEYAATQSGLSVDKLEPILTKFSANLAETTDSGSEMSKLFRTLGVSALDATGQLRPMGDILPALADKFSKIQNPSIRNAVAIKLFGKEGVKFTQILGSGSEGIAAFQKRAEELGLVLGGSTIEAGAKFNDKLDELMLTFTRLRDNVGAELFPVFTELFGTIQTMLIEAKPEIQAFAKAFAAGLPENLRTLISVFKGLWAAMQPIVVILKVVTAIFGTTGTVIGILAVAITGKLILAIYALMGALVQLGVVAAATPIGWIAIGIGLAIAAIAALVAYWEPIKAFFSGLSSWIYVLAGFFAAAYLPIFAFVGLGVAIYKNWEPIKNLFLSIGSAIGTAGSKFAQFFGFGAGTPAASGASGPALGGASVTQGAREGLTNRSSTESRVVVDFNNLPTGTKVKTEKAESPLDLNLGYGMASA